MTHTGEVGTEIAPVVEAEGQLGAVAASIDDVLRRATSIARALTGAEQGALKLWVDSDPGQARKYFSLSEKYAEFRDFRVNPQGLGLHGMAIPPGEVVRLTQDEVESHPLFQNFGNVRPEHPPMRGWLAMSVCGADGRVYGLLQLSDKRDGSDFNADDEECIRELAALVGGTLDALRSAYAAAP
jgi:GAF domain-containing protein